MINTVKKYLDINHYSNQKEDFEEYFNSHPNYPSLYAVTDSLTLLNIDNVAAKIPKEQLAELPESFLANYNNDLVLVAKDENKVIIESEKGDKKNLSYNEFSEKWDGVIVAIEANENIEKVISNQKNTNKFLLLPVVIIVGLSITYHGFNWHYASFLITSTLGFIVSIFIIQEKLGIKNEAVSKFCNMASNTSCDSVIKSNKSEINKWISFSDLPLLFFGVSLISLLLSPFSVTIVGLLSLISVPIIIYSIYIQKFQLKKWCVLCLFVSLILTIQAILYSLNFHLSFNFSNLFFYFFSLIIVASVWLFLKPMIEDKLKIEQSNKEFKKFKRNHEVFNYLSKEIAVLDGFSRLNGIHFGNLDAEVQLTLIISPSCGHCHKAFEDGYQLQKKHPEKVFLNILFNVNPENNDNPYKIIVEKLLALNFDNNQKSHEAIIDWHLHKIGLESWNSKWQVESNMLSNQEIYKQYQWCSTNEFNYTPVKIINNKLFPSEYEIEELKYFLNNFSLENELVLNDKD